MVESVSFNGRVLGSPQLLPHHSLLMEQLGKSLVLANQVCKHFFFREAQVLHIRGTLYVITIIIASRFAWCEQKSSNSS